jgi:hypothetical protein
MAKNKSSDKNEQLKRVAKRLNLTRFMNPDNPVTWSDEVVANHSKAVKELSDAIPLGTSDLYDIDSKFTPESVQEMRKNKQALPVNLENVGLTAINNPERLISSGVTSSNPEVDPSKYLETNVDAIKSRFVLSTNSKGFTSASYVDPNPISSAQVTIAPHIEYDSNGTPVYLGHKGSFTVKTSNSNRSDYKHSINGCGPDCEKRYTHREGTSDDWGPMRVPHQDQEAHLSRAIDDAANEIALYHRGLLGEKNSYGFDAGEYYKGRAKKAQEQQKVSGAATEFTDFQNKYASSVAGVDESGKPNGIEDEDWKSLDANQKAIIAKFAQHHDDYVRSTVDDSGQVHLTLDEHTLSEKMAEKLHKLEHSFGWQDSGYGWHHGELEPKEHDTSEYHRVVLKQNLPIIDKISKLLKNYKFSNLLTRKNINPPIESSQLKEGTSLSLNEEPEQSSVIPQTTTEPASIPVSTTAASQVPSSEPLVFKPSKNSKSGDSVYLHKSSDGLAARLRPMMDGGIWIEMSHPSLTQDTGDLIVGDIDNPADLKRAIAHAQKMADAIRVTKGNSVNLTADLHDPKPGDTLYSVHDKNGTITPITLGVGDKDSDGIPKWSVSGSGGGIVYTQRRKSVADGKPYESDVSWGGLNHDDVYKDPTLAQQEADRRKSIYDEYMSRGGATAPAEGSSEDDLNDANFVRSNAVKILIEEQNKRRVGSSEYSVINKALKRVSNGGENNLQDEQARIKNILEEEKQSYPEDHTGRKALEGISSRLGYNSTAYSYNGALNSEQSSTPTVQEQNQAETEAGSNISAQMTEAAQPTEEPEKWDDPSGYEIRVTQDGKVIPYHEFLNQKKVAIPKIKDSDRPEISAPTTNNTISTYEQARQFINANPPTSRNVKRSEATATISRYSRDSSKMTGGTYFRRDITHKDFPDESKGEQQMTYPISADQENVEISLPNGVVFRNFSNPNSPGPGNAGVEAPAKRAKIPAVGTVNSEALPKDQRFDSNLRPTNISEEHWNALGELGEKGKVARSFLSMYAHKWHSIKDGENKYSLDQLQNDRDAVQRFFSGTYGYGYNGGYFRAYRDVNKSKLATVQSAFGTVPNDGYNEPEVHDTLGKGIVDNIFKAYPMPE